MQDGVTHREDDILPIFLISNLLIFFVLIPFMKKTLYYVLYILQYILRLFFSTKSPNVYINIFGLIETYIIYFRRNNFLITLIFYAYFVRLRSTQLTLQDVQLTNKVKF
jgi:hypothetical protein